MRLKKKIRISADFLIGGEGGDRTLDPRLMSPLLYQLSYLAICVNERVVYHILRIAVNHTPHVLCVCD